MFTCLSVAVAQDFNEESATKQFIPPFFLFEEDPEPSCPVEPAGPVWDDSCASIGSDVKERCCNHPLVLTARAHFDAHCGAGAPGACGPNWTVVCENAGQGACQAGTAGISCCLSCEITLCKQPAQEISCAVLAEEIFHAADMCQMSDSEDRCLPDGNGGSCGATRCLDRICLELRAKHFQCCHYAGAPPKDTPWPFPVDYDTCMVILISPYLEYGVGACWNPFNVAAMRSLCLPPGPDRCAGPLPNFPDPITFPPFYFAYSLACFDVVPDERDPAEPEIEPEPGEQSSVELDKNDVEVDPTVEDCDQCCQNAYEQCEDDHWTPLDGELCQSDRDLCLQVCADQQAQ